MVSSSRIAIARKRRGLTLADLSERVGVSLQSLSSYETGRTAPTLRTKRWREFQPLVGGP
ncbi:helix-turn-helix transcriptional regulator [Streptomyces griseoluteus]|uniref:helix-turn-helix transcriptional regulator n=1 Tax=Streptomyces griseoluteus TaxID=29306 RepID=UPI0036BC1942